MIAHIEHTNPVASMVMAATSLVSFLVSEAFEKGLHDVALGVAILSGLLSIANVIRGWSKKEK